MMLIYGILETVTSLTVVRGWEDPEHRAFRVPKLFHMVRRTYVIKHLSKLTEYIAKVDSSVNSGLWMTICELSQKHYCGVECQKRKKSHTCGGRECTGAFLFSCEPKIALKIVLKYLFCVYECFACMYECVPCESAVPTEARRGCWIP